MVSGHKPNKNSLWVLLMVKSVKLMIFYASIIENLTYFMHVTANKLCSFYQINYLRTIFCVKIMKKPTSISHHISQYFLPFYCTLFKHG